MKALLKIFIGLSVIGSQTYAAENLRILDTVPPEPQNPILRALKEENTELTRQNAHLALISLAQHQRIEEQDRKLAVAIMTVDTAATVLNQNEQTIQGQRLEIKRLRALRKTQDNIILGTGIAIGAIGGSAAMYYWLTRKPHPVPVLQ